jgi:hypothetical protein
MSSRERSKLLIFCGLAAALVKAKAYGRSSQGPEKRECSTAYSMGLRVEECEHATPCPAQPCGVARGQISGDVDDGFCITVWPEHPGTWHLLAVTESG